MKIVFGGAFNPVTNAHIEVYNYLTKKYIDNNTSKYLRNNGCNTPLPSHYHNRSGHTGGSLRQAHRLCGHSCRHLIYLCPFRSHSGDPYYNILRRIDPISLLANVHRYQTLQNG